MKTTTYLTIACLALLVGPSYVRGVGINLTIQQTTAFDSGFNDIGVQPQDGTVPVDTIFQMDVFMEMTDLLPDQDFGAVIFNINSYGDVSFLDFGTLWNPSTGTYDENGPAPGGVAAHWQVGNSDPGNDLQAITVTVTPAEACTRQYGENPRPKTGSPDLLGFPTFLGTVYARRGPNGGTIYITPIAGSSYLTIDENSDCMGHYVAQYEGFSGGSSNFFPKPFTCGCEDNPILPDYMDENGSWVFEDFDTTGNNPNGGWWFDPPTDHTMLHEIIDGVSEFSAVGMPTVLYHPDANGFYIVTSSEGSVVVPQGAVHHFGSGITNFSVSDILPTVNGDDPIASLRS